MLLTSGEPKVFLRNEARDLLDLYAALGDRAESILPKHIIDNLRSFVHLCYQEPTDPAKQQAEINRYILEFKEDIPAYTDVSLMLAPHTDSKAFVYNAHKLAFRKRLQAYVDTEALSSEEK